MSAVEAAALIGNLEFESGGLQYWNAPESCYEGTCGQGIAQWTVGSPRYTGLQAFGGTSGSQLPLYQYQVLWVVHELDTLYSYVLPDVRRAEAGNATDSICSGVSSQPESLCYATQSFEAEYESPSGTNTGQGNAPNTISPGSIAASSLTMPYGRLYYAQSVLDNFGGDTAYLAVDASCGSSFSTVTV